MVMLVVTRKWLNRIMMGEIVWTFACQRYLQVPDPGNVTFKWIKIYATSFDGNWKRNGPFSFDSPAALLTENLIALFEFPRSRNLCS
ncbi:hypothetical protein OROMI_016313 [Orobanche minor]